MPGWGDNPFGIYWYGDPTGFDATHLSETPVISVQSVGSQASNSKLTTGEANSISSIAITNVGS